MKYENFVKIYYRQVMSTLDKYKMYRGSINTVQFNEELPANIFHVVDRNSWFLPQRELNIDVDYKYFLVELERLAVIFPDLDILGLTSTEELYNNLSGEEDEKILNYIEIIIQLNIDILVSEGVLK